jgi:hypothetical protein
LSTLGCSPDPPIPTHIDIDVSSLAGFTIQISSAKLTPLTVDSGFSITGAAPDSVGIIYPGERVDLLLTWDDTSPATSPRLHISLDHEHVLPLPSFENSS